MEKEGEKTMTFCEYCVKTLSETKPLMIKFKDRTYYIDSERVRAISPATFKRVANAKVLTVMETEYQSFVKVDISFDNNVEII